jgi:hypothetical protein
MDFSPLQNSHLQTKNFVVMRALGGLDFHVPSCSQIALHLGKGRGVAFTLLGSAYNGRLTLLTHLKHLADLLELLAVRSPQGKGLPKLESQGIHIVVQVTGWQPHS